MSNLKTPSVEIAPTKVAAVIDWLNRNHVDARATSMDRGELLTLQRGDAVVMHEATMGEDSCGVERIYAPGTLASFWMLEDLGGDEGLTAILIIGPNDDEAIVNCFSERDPSGYPFRRAVGG